MYEFPCVESTSPSEIENSVKSNLGDQVFKIKHELTHQTLYISFHVLPSKTVPVLDSNQSWKSVSELSKLPFPKPFVDFLLSRNIIT